MLNDVQGASVGNFNIDRLSVNNLVSESGVVPNVTVTFNAYGAVEELLTGTFGGDFVDSSGMSHVIDGSFRVQRDN